MTKPVKYRSTCGIHVWKPNRRGPCGHCAVWLEHERSHTTEEPDAQRARRLIAAGHTVSEVAKELGTQPSKVKLHISRESWSAKAQAERVRNSVRKLAAEGRGPRARDKVARDKRLARERAHEEMRRAAQAQ